MKGFPGGASGKEPTCKARGQEFPLEEGPATHSSILAWRISQTEEPGGLQSMGSQRVGQDEVTFTFQSEGQTSPVGYFCTALT